MAGTGFASHEVPSDRKVHDVPIVIATEENIEPYGRFVRDPSKEEIWLNDWPVTGKRKLCPGSGKQKSIETAEFTIRWENDCARIGTERVYGRREGDCVLVRECNYHPDSGQTFYPLQPRPFVALLALPGDNLKLEDWRAFYFDGTVGLQIRPNIWHQPCYPSQDESLAFSSTQGEIKATVIGDTLNEFGTWLRVPLSP